MTAQNAASLDTKTLLQSLQQAVAERTQPDVFHLTEVLMRAAAPASNNLLLDLAAAVAAEYARGNFERANSLVGDGLFLAEAKIGAAMAA